MPLIRRGQAALKAMRPAGAEVPTHPIGVAMSREGLPTDEGPARLRLLFSRPKDGGAHSHRRPRPAADARGRVRPAGGPITVVYDPATRGSPKSTILVVAGVMIALTRQMAALVRLAEIVRHASPVSRRRATLSPRSVGSGGDVQKPPRTMGVQ